jgi:cell division protein FtsA
VQQTVVGIDIGTTKICTLVGEATQDDGELRIIGVGVAPSRGIRKGVVVNVEEASAAISESIDKAERISGVQIQRASVGLAGSHISSTNSHGVVAISRGSRGIQQTDIQRALDSARNLPLPQNREVLHVIPRVYTVDGDDGIRNPLGMQATRLEVEAHIISGSTSSIHNLVKCVESANVEIQALVLEPLSSGEAVLSQVEKEMGVALADIGGGTTDIAIFIEGSIWHTVILPSGGEQITNDVAVGLRTPFITAEELKLKYGHTRPAEIQPEEKIEITSFGEAGRQQVSRHFLAEIIEARVEEILDAVLQEIKRSGYDGLLPAGIVLCGGTADLPGIRDLARERLALPVRIGRPNNLIGLVDVLSSPSFATSVGLLRWALKQEAPEQRYRRGSSNLNIPRWLRAFLPD